MQGSQYLFAYTIKIQNEGTSTVQLKRRYWLITDGEFQTQEVRSVNVVLCPERLGRTIVCAVVQVALVFSSPL